MSDRQTTALVLFMIFALALYLNNSSSPGSNGVSKLSEIVKVLMSGFNSGSGAVASYGSFSGPGATGGASGDKPVNPVTLPPLWGKPAYPDINIPEGYYSPAFITDFQKYLGDLYRYKQSGGVILN